MLKLKRYRVEGFRSVSDSGWIDTDKVTSLIGVNESGKTNLLLPLWKLNPAGAEGKIVPLADYPRSEYTERRHENNDRVFVLSEFDTDDDFQVALAEMTGLPKKHFEVVRFDRLFGGNYHVRFPLVKLPGETSSEPLIQLLSSSKSALVPSTTDENLSTMLVDAIDEANALIENFGDTVTVSQIVTVRSKLQAVPDAAVEKANKPTWNTLLQDFATAERRLGLVHPDQIPEARQLALKRIPKFVYYSNYGNLDSEIYLPHVIQNLERKGLGQKEAAKARTLRVLFKFVGLEPKEVLALGKPTTDSTPEEIERTNERLKERSVLLQSASTKLTKEFKNWWKQGNYRFRFEADGDHFRIWVSDDLRPEEIELEGRSTGLQWFLSFFLVFLVESEEAHDGAILLLDEPGLSLHPLAQKDLTSFFDGLSETNQLLYTTHSPFLVDPDRLDQVRSVYVDSSGATSVSADLRAGSKPTSPEGRSVYAVHSALGLSVSDSLLQGCTVVIVEGPSDQFYMSAFKTVLIALGKIKPMRELVFVPGGGAKGVAALVPVFTGKDESPPHVVLDSDAQGLRFAESLRAGIYGGNHTDRVRNVGSFVDGIEHAEIEDLVPHELMVDVVGRMYRGEEDFSDFATPDDAIIPQVEGYAEEYGFELTPGWKVNLARAVKQRIVSFPDKISPESVDLWARLLQPFSGTSAETRKAKRPKSPRPA